MNVVKQRIPPFGGLIAALAVLAVFAFPRHGSASQVFFLDFDSLLGDPGFHHEYTPEEREQIASEMHVHFEKLGMTVTHEPPGSGVFYSTIFFNSSAAGTSDGIDFRNETKTDNARLNAKAMLAFVGIDEADIDSEKIVRASINIGMHEALHLLGARHQDGYTIPGFGVPTGGVADRYTPPYPGPRGAAFTRDTFMGLAAGVFGLTAEKLLDKDLFISPRSALKAVLGEVPQLVTAQVAPNNHPTLAQPVEMRRFSVPNTFPETLELPPEIAAYLPPGVGLADLEIFAEAAVVTGTITSAEEDHPVHYYLLPAAPGARYTIEAFSAVLDHRTGFTPMEVGVAVIDPFHPSFLTMDYYGTSGFNRDGIEGTDPAMVDFMAPWDREVMIVDVWSQASPPGTGDYELLIYRMGVGFPDGMAPVLSIERSNDDAVLSWTALADGFLLEETGDLVTGSWLTVPQTPELDTDGGRFTVTAPMEGKKGFFRLRSND